MSHSDNSQERRRSPRIKREIALTIKTDDYDVIGQTRDISSIGAYCTVNRYIPPFSLISIVLLLPGRANRRGGIADVRCRGVVVRSEESPQRSNEYNIAIYFDRLRRSDKAKLLEYVQRYL
jgi:hypothetical protein